ncbi:C4-dicarboxylate ABC transporter substrate-binding protein [Marinobacter lutaoensis]|uniref:C4-dicarboxylate ABC transporter substrate-binding protein n=1 Tax=Marinobacter lutaoensis TaxID=135739 RepID=A0A1V2DUB6_9GAMM|nr:TRAP transporter substrate-binding protein [Marinobacter lutaoensis]ONF44325.1 C4-dicarboxylate ABC transporter substrate-binding protein [Marinobacter lutaoensis]
MNAFWKTTRKTLTAFVLALVAGVTSMQAMAEQTFNWRFSNLYSRGTAYAEVYENFARNIETMSNGRIRIQVLYAGEGVGQTGVLGAVKSGLVQMGAIFQPAHSGEIPFGVVEIGLPGTTDDATKLSALFHEQGWQPILEQAYNQQGVEWIETYFQPAVYVLTNKPIRSIDDFKGLKIRAPGAYGKFFRELGASPVSLAWNEIYTSLATGVIDGSIGSNLIDHRDGNHVEVAKYMYPLPVAGAQAMPIIVNKKAWDSLPEDLKAIVKTAGARHAQEQLDKSTVWVSQAVADMEAKGLQWSPEPSEADRQAWRAAARKVWNDYAKGDKISAELVKILEASGAAH